MPFDRSSVKTGVMLLRLLNSSRTSILATVLALMFNIEHWRVQLLKEEAYLHQLRWAKAKVGQNRHAPKLNLAKDPTCCMIAPAWQKRHCKAILQSI